MPTFFPSDTATNKAPAHPNSTSSGWAPKASMSSVCIIDNLHYKGKYSKVFFDKKPSLTCVRKGLNKYKKEYFLMVSLLLLLGVTLVEFINTTSGVNQHVFTSVKRM